MSTRRFIVTKNLNQLTVLEYKDGEDVPWKRSTYSEDGSTETSSIDIIQNASVFKTEKEGKEFDSFEEACEHISGYFSILALANTNSARVWDDMSWNTPEAFWAHKLGSSVYLRIKDGYVKEKVTFPYGQIYRETYYHVNRIRPDRDILRDSCRFDSLENAIQASIDHESQLRDAKTLKVKCLSDHLISVKEGH